MAVTDTLCLGITISIIVIYVGTFGATFALGNPQQIGKPYDMNGNPCKDGSFIYFLTPQEKYLFRTTCVSKCPKQKDTSLQCTSTDINCTPNLSPTNPGDQVLIYDTDLYQGMACLPSDFHQFQIIVNQMNAPLLQRLAQDLEEDIISVFFVFFFALFLGNLILKFQRSYLQFIQISANYTYFIGIVVMLLIVSNKLSLFNRADLIIQLGQKRPLISEGMKTLLDYYFLKTNFILLLIILSIVLLIALLDIILNPLPIQQRQLSGFIILGFAGKIKYLLQPFYLSILQLINYGIYYYGLINSISIVQFDHTGIYANTSIIGLIIFGLQTALFIYISVLICFLGDAIVFYQSQHRVKAQQHHQSSFQFIKLLCAHLGSISKFTFFNLLYLPKRWYVDFLYMINKKKLAKESEKSLYEYRSTKLGVIMFEGQENNSDDEPIQQLYNEGCTFLYKIGYSFMVSSILLQLLIGISFSAAFAIGFLSYSISYIYLIQIGKGGTAMELLQDEIQTFRQKNEADNQAKSLLDYMIIIYLWIRHIEKQDCIEKQD